MRDTSTGLQLRAVNTSSGLVSDADAAFGLTTAKAMAQSARSQAGCESPVTSGFMRQSARLSAEA